MPRWPRGRPETPFLHAEMGATRCPPCLAASFRGWEAAGRPLRDLHELVSEARGSCRGARSARSFLASGHWQSRVLRRGCRRACFCAERALGCRSRARAPTVRSSASILLIRGVSVVGSPGSQGARRAHSLLCNRRATPRPRMRRPRTTPQINRIEALLPRWAHPMAPPIRRFVPSSSTKSSLETG